MDDRPIDTDVVVIGGGPAGAAAAITCATRGLRVVLCEREPAGRDRPGETLHPGVEPLLRQLGLADRLEGVIGARHSGVWIEWGGPPRFETFGSDDSGPWNGFQVWRADFDVLLLSRARELGVDVRQPCAVTAAHLSGTSRWDVATTADHLAARMVIDATGMARWLGRALGVRSPARSRQLIARYGYLEGACPQRDAAPALVGDASGWTWTARVRAGLYQWTRVAFDERPDSDWVPDELRGLTARGPTRGADVTWRMAERAAGPDWFIAGDAAALLDPTSSHGVLKALMSGMMAGHLAAAVLDGKAPAEETANAYQDWLAGWFAADVARLTEFYRGLGVTALA
jgi:flavin-dependent dehydrogenase